MKKEMVLSDATETALLLVQLAIEEYVRRLWLFRLPWRRRVWFLHRTLTTTEIDLNKRIVEVRGCYITSRGQEKFRMEVQLWRKKARLFLGGRMESVYRRLLV